MSKTCVLLINLGTPESSDFLSVYRYLTEFLNDPRVIDLPVLARFILVNLLVIPSRCKKTTEAYKKIITPEGSPLLVNSQKLKNAVAKELGEEYEVEIAMRYGKPCIQSALKNLKHSNHLIVIPLFPHYSSAATGSAIAQLLQELAHLQNIPEIKIIRDFYNDPGFIQSYASNIKEKLGEKKPDLILFSYHGLPERHINKSGCQAKCDRLHACPKISTDNLYCYRAQCYATSQLLADALGLEPHQYQVAFQSRLGRTPWIKPYTDLVLNQLREQSIKSIAVVSPSFVADCLETLEEINIRMREQWRLAGGSEFIFIPCLNDHPAWVKTLANKISLHK